MRAPVCECHPKHNQTGPTRVRARYRRFYVRSKFRTLPGRGDLAPDVHSRYERSSVRHLAKTRSGFGMKEAPEVCIHATSHE